MRDTLQTLRRFNSKTLRQRIKIMIKRFLLTTSVVVAFAAAVQTAKATDLPMRAPTVQIMSPVSVYNWTGIYVGLNGGYGFGSVDPLTLFSNNFNSLNSSANGWLAGGTMGAQIQS